MQTNTLLKYYTSMLHKKQVNLDILTIFVSFDNFYVNTIMSTDPTYRQRKCTIFDYYLDIALRRSSQTQHIAAQYIIHYIVHVVN